MPPSRSAAWALPMSALISRRASASAADFSARAFSSASRRAAASAASRAAVSRTRADSSSARRSRLLAGRFTRPPAHDARRLQARGVARCSAMISSQRSMARDARDLKLRGRLRRERLPARMEVPEGRLIDRVVDAMTVPLEGFAGGDGVAPALFDPLLLGMERVALLPDDLVDALVLAAQLLHEASELRGIRHGLRRELPDAARGTVQHEPCDSLRVIDGGERAGQPLGVPAIPRHSEERGDIRRSSAQLLEIDGSRIDQLREALLRDSLETRGYRARRVGAQSRERPETLAVRRACRSPPRAAPRPHRPAQWQ